MRKTWVPSAMERKCLQHLDAPGSWNILREERPDNAEILPWRPFRRIFGFNLTLFSVVLVALFFLVELASGMGATEIMDDLPYGLGFSLLVAIGLSLYVMNLYRKTWNRRASRLQAEDAAAAL